MKFLSWMQNKFNGKQDNRKPNTYTSNSYHAKQEPQEEFRDRTHGLLVIGTFGNSNEIKEILDNQKNTEEDPSTSEEIADFTPEEIVKLQKELTKLLRKKPNVEKEISELPLDRFLNCPSSLEVDRRISNALCNDSGDKEEDIEKTLSLILGKCKDICVADNKKKAIGKKSISFLLKKMFVCKSGFAPTPSLRDTLQESRMEKLLRTILHKKIYAQNSSRASSMKKFLEDRKMTGKGNEDEPEERTDDRCKWVKTDSEYIVLEI
ncbi:PREDICTED: uncharacterized protein LOC109360545 [Lupinus angustifolius]|nr:PREDICTED: uncharacterized protein LOC109360545 [Lupinus angustifolius]XP_019461057.1 PREDICTED: uncharacterized protein LOC109360545 [Lupinus angustifolius]